ncbi:hypothetical protein F5Y14DRAFT_89739 [Nemania sp. NC0429]|nr:hypothetical protein F5Y14DRAFT_89739 [Nemania sp. NC0429]
MGRCHYLPRRKRDPTDGREPPCDSCPTKTVSLSKCHGPRRWMFERVGKRREGPTPWQLSSPRPLLSSETAIPGIVDLGWLGLSLASRSAWTSKHSSLFLMPTSARASNRFRHQSGGVEGPVTHVFSRVPLLRNPMRWGSKPIMACLVRDGSGICYVKLKVGYLGVLV